MRGKRAKQLRAYAKAASATAEPMKLPLWIWMMDPDTTKKKRETIRVGRWEPARHPEGHFRALLRKLKGAYRASHV